MSLALSTCVGNNEAAAKSIVNSPSGHGVLVGQQTRKPIAFVVKSKRCNICNTWKKKMTLAPIALPVPVHKCTINHTSSSGSMEPQACLEMVISTFEQYNVVVTRIVIDDDSSMRVFPIDRLSRGARTPTIPTSNLPPYKHRYILVVRTGYPWQIPVIAPACCLLLHSSTHRTAIDCPVPDINNFTIKGTLANRTVISILAYKIAKGLAYSTALAGVCVLS
jgi:hypothetical protein